MIAYRWIVIILTFISKSLCNKTIKWYDCKARSVLVPIASYGHYALPQYLKVKKCNGGTMDGNIFSCESTKTTKKLVNVRNYDGKNHIIEINEDLECEEKCFCGDCPRGRVKREIPHCQHELSWDARKCRCTCPVPKIEQDTTMPEIQRSDRCFEMSVKTLILIMLVELVVILVAVKVFSKVKQHYIAKNKEESVHFKRYNDYKSTHNDEN